jgi:hypothetical protein
MQLHLLRATALDRKLIDYVSEIRSQLIITSNMTLNHSAVPRLKFGYFILNASIRSLITKREIRFQSKGYFKENVSL